MAEKCEVCELHQATGKHEIFCKTSVKHIIRRTFGMYALYRINAIVQCLICYNMQVALPDSEKYAGSSSMIHPHCVHP